MTPFTRAPLAREAAGRQPVVERSARGPPFADGGRSIASEPFVDGEPRSERVREAATPLPRVPVPIRLNQTSAVLAHRRTRVVVPEPIVLGLPVPAAPAAAVDFT